jgi:hypothetical protein
MMKKSKQNKLKKVLVVFLSVILALATVYFIGTGLMRRGDVYIGEYSVSEDGKTMEIRAGVAGSMGYIRSAAPKRDGDRLKLTFYAAFGGLNSSLGAKSVYELSLDEEITEICLFRGSEGYETIFAKNTETDQWIRVYGNIYYAK